jgi:mono/diheme cytochrome c family protein
VKTIKTLVVSAAIGLLSVAAFIYSGVFNIAADDPHWPLTYKILTVLRDRSVKARSAAITLPALDDDRSIRLGAGNYDAMCTPCHLSPGTEESELSRGLYPKPPSWRELGQVDADKAFWIIKHGIKMSGMPAWGKSMSDPHIWNIVALLKKLPQLTPDAYRKLVESSPGHFHESDDIHADTPAQSH